MHCVWSEMQRCSSTTGGQHRRSCSQPGVRNTITQCAGIGCLGALSSVDWGVRKGAADTLLALNRMLGPLLEHAAMPERPRVPRCIEAIAAAKHDRVRPVRDSMALVLTAFQELHEWSITHPVCSPNGPMHVCSCQGSRQIKSNSDDSNKTRLTWHVGRRCGCMATGLRLFPDSHLSSQLPLPHRCSQWQLLPHLGYPPRSEQHSWCIRRAHSFLSNV